MKKKILIILYLTAVVSLIFSSGLRDKVALTLNSMGLGPYLIIFLLSMMPISELRGSMLAVTLLIDIGYKVSIPYAALISIMGNMLPIFFILFVFKYCEPLLRKVPIFNSILDWIFKRTKAKSKSVEQNEELGLMLFVALPSPFTGAWTGSLVAYIMKLSYLKSLLFIFLGVLCAAVIMTCVAYLGTIAMIVGIIILILMGILKGFYDFLKKKKVKTAENEA